MLMEEKSGMENPILNIVRPVFPDVMLFMLPNANGRALVIGYCG